jgi:hypothetical protein
MPPSVATRFACAAVLAVFSYKLYFDDIKNTEKQFSKV